MRLPLLRERPHVGPVKPLASAATTQSILARIVEAFAANPACYVDSTEDVEKLDESGIALVWRMAGVEVFRLEHRFGHAPQGASYRSRMTVGVGSGATRWLFNSLIRPAVFPDAMGRAWLTHNAEEVSMLENIFPPLYAAR